MQQGVDSGLINLKEEAADGSAIYTDADHTEYKVPKDQVSKLLPVQESQLNGLYNIWDLEDVHQASGNRILDICDRATRVHCDRATRLPCCTHYACDT